MRSLVRMIAVAVALAAGGQALRRGSQRRLP